MSYIQEALEHARTFKAFEAVMKDGRNIICRTSTECDAGLIKLLELSKLPASDSTTVLEIRIPEVSNIFTKGSEYYA